MSDLSQMRAREITWPSWLPYRAHMVARMTIAVDPRATVRTACWHIASVEPPRPRYGPCGLPHSMELPTYAVGQMVIVCRDPLPQTMRDVMIADQSTHPWDATYRHEWDPVIRPLLGLEGIEQARRPRPLIAMAPIPLTVDGRTDLLMHLLDIWLHAR